MMGNYVTKEFTRYTVYYISGNSPKIGVPQEMEIDCFDQQGKRVGAMYFFPDDLPLPANNVNVNGIYLYFRSRRFNDVMNILKDEKPLYLALNTANGAGNIGTAWEPVGEQEGV